jgi:broad specificity phosphatase PhoE
VTLLLIRHGPTEWNQDRRLQGRADIPLSPEGREAVAAWRIPHRFRHLPVRSSPLQRAVATAAILGLSPTPEPALVELDWGSWEGRSLAELRLGDPKEVARREALGLDFRAPDGESYREAAVRVAPFLEGDGILVGHRGIMLAALAIRTGWAMTSPPPVEFAHSDAILIENGSVATVALGPAPAEPAAVLPQ